MELEGYSFAIVSKKRNIYLNKLNKINETLKRLTNGMTSNSLIRNLNISKITLQKLSFILNII